MLAAEDGAQAWDVIRAAPDCELRLVIPDRMMPEIDELELTRRIRSQTPAEGAPYRYVILLTARGRAEDRRDGLAAGADDFLVKPLDSGELLARLEVARRIMAL